MVFLLVLAWLLLTLSPAKAAGIIHGAVTLDELIQSADAGNQELFASEFKAQQYSSRIALATNLDDSLLAYYYLGFPARILREEEPPPRKEGSPPANRAVNQTIRGRALFERSTFMIKSMAENQAAWYRGVNEDLHLQIVRQIREDFFQLYFQNRIIAVNEKTLAAIDNLLNITRERYAVGKLTQQEVLQVQSEKTTLLLQLLALRQKRLALVANLNYLAGRDPAAPLDPILKDDLTHSSLGALPHSVIELTNYMQRHRPLIKGYRSLLEIYGIMRLMIPMYYNMVLRQDGTLEVDSGQRATRAEMTDFQNKVTAEIVTTHAQLTADLETARLYGDLLLPQRRHILTASQADFEVGRTDLRTPLQAMITLNRTQSEYYQALANHQISLAKLEAASAMPLF